MNVEDLILVSVDDHVVEPPDMFDGHLPDKYKDLAPKVIQHATTATTSGRTRARSCPTSGSTPWPGAPPEEYGIEPTSFAEMRHGLLRHRRARRAT